MIDICLPTLSHSFYWFDSLLFASQEAQPFERIEVTKDQALEMFSENNFKVG